MARPIKTGLDYFPMDTVLDENVEALEMVHGNDGFAWIVKFWQAAYRTENGEIVFRAEYSRKILAKRTNITLEKQNAIIDTCLELGLLDKNAYENDVLTSSGIRKRLEKVNKIRHFERERKVNNFPAGKHTENVPKTPERKEKEIYIRDTLIEEIYQQYPARDINNQNRSTGRCSKNKKQIEKLLKSGVDVKKAIKSYVQDCGQTKTYLKNFTTFLNNIPEPQEPAPVQQSVPSAIMSMGAIKLDQQDIDRLAALQEKKERRARGEVC
jgi:hypothetical protein